MNKVKKTGIWGRLKAAARAFKGETLLSRLTVGLEIKRCDECNRAEVVRCKDCMSYGDAGRCRNCNLWRNPDDFCSRGRRKGEQKKRKDVIIIAQGPYQEPEE